MSDTLLDRLAGWGSQLTLEKIPPRVVERAKVQVLSTLGAVYSGSVSDPGQAVSRAFAPAVAGPARVTPHGWQTSPAHAAFLMSSWSMILDFDDVMLGGHTGHSSVLVPWAYAESLGASGEELLVAQVVANEIAARINMVCAVGSTRGQMATHLHLAAAAAARARLEGRPAPFLAEAIGFALSYPAKALFPAFLGSDAKALCASWPIRMGLESVDAVAAGLRGNRAILEDGRGLFATLADVPVYDFLGGLGERWHTETNCFKVHPACGYLSAALDATAALVRENGLRPENISEVDVFGSVFTVGMDAHSAPYLEGEASRVATLTFSTPYTLACVLLDGALLPRHLKREQIEDPRVWELAAKVRVHHDLELTATALLGDLPVGAALTRVSPLRAAGFVLGLGVKAFGTGGAVRRLGKLSRLALRVARSGGARRPLDSAKVTKPLGARVRIRTTTGAVHEVEVATPQGFVGAGEDDLPRRLMLEKLQETAAPVIGEDAAREVGEGVVQLERLGPEEISRLLRASCTEGARSERGGAERSRHDSSTPESSVDPSPSMAGRGLR